jgi:hypothetical protein
MPFRLLQMPIEIRPHIGTSSIAGIANKLRLEIGEADIIWPLVAADGGPMASTS